MGKSISSLPSVFKRHCWPALAALTAVIGASIAYLVVTPKVYQVSARLMIEEKKVSISELGRDLSQGTSSVPGGANPLGNQSELVKSEKVVKRAVDQVFPQETERERAKKVTDKLKKGMKVKIVPATNILELSYQDKDPALATKLINAIAQAMAEESTEALRLEAKAVRQFLEIEVPKRREAAELAELAENRYRQESGIISFEEQSKSLVSSLSTLEDQERTLSAQLEDVKVRVNKLQKITDNSNPQSAYAAGRIGQDKELIDLRVKLAELDTKLSEAQVRFTDDNPLVISLLQKRDSLLALYNDKVNRIAPSYQNISPGNVASDPLSQNLTSAYIAAETERSALTEKLRALQSDRAELKGRLTQLPLKQQPLTALSRQREEATASLKLLQGKLEEAHIAEAQLVGNVRIIEQAKVPELPVGPNQKAVLVIAVVFGAILGVGIIMVLEILDDRLHDGVEAEDLLKLPLLGVLPDIPESALSLEKPDRFLDDTELVEPYRRLLKTLEFRSQKKIKLIVVSSTLSGEGKSLVVSHLAAVSAMLSRRTLIIDANLRQSGEQNLLNIPGAPGLTDVINKKISLLHAVQLTDLENLSILGCGELGDRPASVLESSAMKALLAEAASLYDLVILDTPPVSNCADAHALSQSSDGLVMIVRPNFTPKGKLLKTVSELTANGAPILGIVANGKTNRKNKSHRKPLKRHHSPSKFFKHLTDIRTPINNSVRG